MPLGLHSIALGNEELSSFYSKYLQVLHFYFSSKHKPTAYLLLEASICLYEHFLCDYYWKNFLRTGVRRMMTV